MNMDVSATLPDHLQNIESKQGKEMFCIEMISVEKLENDFLRVLLICLLRVPCKAARY
jgi:hypothetical protein